VFAGLALALSVLASGHAILYKRDSRAVISWVGFIWLVPLGGALLYFGLGVNRLRRKAAGLRGKLPRFRAEAAAPDCPPEELHLHLPKHTGHLNLLARMVGTVVERPLVPGNRLVPLINGDEAYPAMLDAFRAARQSISFSSYIFDRDDAGRAFADALGEAVRRGVQVRVLIDATGTRYSFPTIVPLLRRKGINCAKFLPAFAIRTVMSFNLRSHRKIAVVDGRIGFTGGMNIRQGNCLNRKPKGPTQDIHFRVEGPVVAQLQEAFADDWLFTTGEALRGDLWFPKLEKAGTVVARGVPDGPDENFEKLRWTLLGAISISRESVRIVTPYFLPDSTIVTALNLAAMRGVQVDIVLPVKNNLPFVHWASRAMWWQLLVHGCKIWLAPPPFDHSKLMLVDGAWVLLGSANWDARSLRLNFEYNLECYDADLACRVADLIESKRRHAHLVTLDENNNRPLPGKLRDGIARLLTPYL